MALLLCGAISSTSLLTAQSSHSVASGRISISTGIGLAPTYYKAGETTGLPPLTFKLGVDLTKQFSLAAFAGYSSVTTGEKSFSQDFGSYLVNKTMVVGLRAETKKVFSKKFEVYGGAMLGYHHSDVKEYDSETHVLAVRASDAATPFDPNAPKGKMVYSAFMGANYRFAKKIGAYCELGYGISLVNAGLTFRL